MFLLGFILYGTLCASWTWLTISFSTLGKLSTIISSKIVSYPFFCSSSSGTTIIQMLVHLILSQRSLKLSSVLFILLTLFSSSEVIFTILSSSSLIRSSASDILLLIPSRVLSCIGEGNGNPIQYSCLENPKDRGAWWAAVYGVAQSQTWLMWLSSSSSRVLLISVIVLSLNVYSLILLGLCLLILAFSSVCFQGFLIIFTIIILNSFSGSLPISSSFIWTSVFLVCSSICVVFLSLFIIIIIYLLCLRSPFPGFKVEFFLSSFWFLPS